MPSIVATSLMRAEWPGPSEWLCRSGKKEKVEIRRSIILHAVPSKLADLPALRIDIMLSIFNVALSVIRARSLFRTQGLFQGSALRGYDDKWNRSRFRALSPQAPGLSLP